MPMRSGLALGFLRTVREQDGDAVLNGITVLAGGAFEGVFLLAKGRSAGGTHQDVDQIL